MSLKIRRVVTGHDDHGKAVVLFDETCRNVISRRERHHSCVVWSTASFPVDNSGREDESARPTGAPPPDGTVFRIIEYGPGVAPRNHRTSTIDYAVVISGEIDMELDDDIVHLKAGDVLVQRGAIHNWVNRGSEPCVIAFVLIAAHPVVRGGKTLDAMG
jgi:mannose-6-phosphate isomerase-like protein (cupin superfamily)